jgi:putrescine aminotransferase
LNDVRATYAKHVNPAFVQLLGVFGYGRVFTRAQGIRIFDDAGREYLDFLAGFGATNLGHNHPRLRARLARFLDEDAVQLNHVGPSPHAAALAEALAARSGLDIAMFSSSGAEAVEAGMKLARAATGRGGFLSCANAFHGTNLGNLSVMDGARWRDPFEPLLAGCERVPFGNTEALQRALAGRKHAAFVVEPILAEGGVILPPAGYLAEAQALCRKYGTVLVLDEVQTGIGRTGTLFAAQTEGFVPDVLVLAKSLGGGIAAIGATLVRGELHKKAYGRIDRFDLQSSTFAGNALACVAALETLAIVDDEKLGDNAAIRGKQLVEALRARLAGHPFVKDVRGRGLLVGVELGPTDSTWAGRLAPSLVASVSRNVFGQWAAVKLLERGIICQPASQQWDVLKVEPPLIVDAAGIDAFVDALGAVLGEYQSLAPLLQDVVRRMSSQWRAGGEFR